MPSVAEKAGVPPATPLTIIPPATPDLARRRHTRPTLRRKTTTLPALTSLGSRTENPGVGGSIPSQLGRNVPQTCLRLGLRMRQMFADLPAGGNGGMRQQPLHREIFEVTANRRRRSSALGTRCGCNRSRTTYCPVPSSTALASPSSWACPRSAATRCASTFVITVLESLRNQARIFERFVSERNSGVSDWDSERARVAHGGASRIPPSRGFLSSYSQPAATSRAARESSAPPATSASQFTWKRLLETVERFGDIRLLN